jgi:predicted TIM-barrel fold metal-dependent hydrolase
MHVFGPRSRYPYSGKRTYTPRPASLADYQKKAATIGLQRVVFVQPSAYGADNRCILRQMILACCSTATGGRCARRCGRAILPT